MKILNSSKIQKTLRGKNLSFVFPPGISEQPDIPQISNYISLHPDLSIYKEKIKKDLKHEVKLEEVIKKEKPIIKTKRGKKDKRSHSINKLNKEG